MLKTSPAESVGLSFWSPPYHVGKSYEAAQTFAQLQSLIKADLANKKKINLTREEILAAKEKCLNKPRWRSE